MNMAKNIAARTSDVLIFDGRKIVLLVVMFALVAALGAATIRAATPYTIDESLRFNDDDSAYLSRTPGSAGNRDQWTFSTWIKRVGLASNQGVFSAYVDDDNKTQLTFSNTTNTFSFEDWNGAVSQATLTTDAAFRDPTKWMHLVVAVDTGETGVDQVKIYIDGDLQTYSGTPDYGGTDSQVNSTAQHRIGDNQESDYFDGYMSDVYLIDGQQLAPTAFGDTDANGYWRPKEYTGSYGTNGFHLDFSASGDLGADRSGNENDWTENNLDATDQVIDTPTNSFATFSEDITPAGSFSNAPVAEGGLEVGGTNTYKSMAPFGVTSGKWYFEATSASTWDDGGYPITGWFDVNAIRTSAYPGDVSGGVGAGHDNYFTNGSSSNGNLTVTSDDTLQVLFDADTGRVWFGVNGDIDGNMDTLAEGDAGTIDYLTGNYVPGSASRNSKTINFNFGQLQYATSTASASTYYPDAGGYFMYEPPPGFKALSTANYPTPVIAQPKKFFNAITYRGTGAEQSIRTEPAAITTYTSSGNFIVPPGVTSVDYLVVAGGGGGGHTIGGGGGGGGFKTGTLSVNPGDSIVVTVGAGGAAGTGAGNGSDGGDSVFGSITATGGGGGGSDSSQAGRAGGSGGGGGNSGSSGGTGGAASPSGQGNAGGTSSAGTSGAGGGGAGAAGSANSGSSGGSGGAGMTSSISGSSVTYAGGGGGSSRSGSPASGGAGGGGDGAADNLGTHATAGTANTGGGGGGGDQTSTAGAGGSGIVIVSYTPVVSGISFQPDLVWIKNRDTTDDHQLVDSVRGVTAELETNSTDAGTTDANGLTAFNSNGFSLGTGANGYNDSGEDFVAWNWRTGSTAGFDIVHWQGNGTARYIPHNLGRAPDMIIVKATTTTHDWAIYHSANTSAPHTDFLQFDTGATGDSAGYWNDTRPTSTGFMIGTNDDVNEGGATPADYIAYVFASTTGYSAFGSYTGNGNDDDGIYVHTGFKPRFVMIKRTNSTGSWYMYDNERTPYNEVDDQLLADANTNETTGSEEIDWLSNGFKLRNPDAGVNGSGSTYVYAAFAEQPFALSAASSALEPTVLSGGVSFLQDLFIADTLSKGSGTFVIDHPLDPFNKLLFHSFVESPDVKNLYDGIATLDENGEAVITLPDYFEALNKDFRYQTKPIDTAMPNLHIKEEVQGNQFTIGGGAPGGRVSWQVTGIRHDPYIQANPIEVEVPKGSGQPVDAGECIFAPLCN